MNNNSMNNNSMNNNNNNNNSNNNMNNNNSNINNPNLAITNPQKPTQLLLPSNFLRKQTKKSFKT